MRSPKPARPRSCSREGRGRMRKSLRPPTSAAWRWCLRGAAISDIRDFGLSRKTLVGLLLAAIAVYFVALGNSAIWDANEAFYVETPREMIEAQAFVNPTFNYEPRLNKPVLSYWIVAGLYKAFGVSVAVQRFGIALGALIIIACAFVLGRTTQDSRSGIHDQGFGIQDQRSGISD